MATISQTSPAPPQSATNHKSVVVRVKRKSYQSRLEAFWLAINEKSSKPSLSDFEKLSISDSAVHAQVEEWKAKKFFVKYVKTVSSSETTVDIVQSFVSNCAGGFDGKQKSEERMRVFKKDSKQEKHLSKAIQSQEVLAKSACFKQICSSQMGNKTSACSKALHEFWRFYDVIRVDAEEKSNEAQGQDFISGATKDIKSDDYVYDYYAMKDDIDIDHEAASSPFPLVQVEDEDFYGESDDELEYDSDDSKAEDDPRNEFPDETSEEEDEVESEASTDESEEEEEKSDIASTEPSEFEFEDDYYEDGIYDDGFDEDEIPDYYYDEGDDFYHDDTNL